ncbi:MAG: alanine--tRNA ligase, partial [Halanaerobiales bacterium]|nr:alanine--tRNA ligase [Halanaerobiales bacterium]
KELKEIEYRVNEQIINNLKVVIKEMSIDQAKEKGAQALFTEKYGQRVRVVQIGDYSIELCGGTHVQRTGDLGLFKILNEGSIASGVRRIEAVTGFKALEYVEKQKDLLNKSTDILNTDLYDLPNKIEKMKLEVKDLKKEIRSLKDKIAHSKSVDLIEQVKKIKGVNLLTHKLDRVDSNGLRKMADQLQKKLESGIIVLASVLEDKVLFVIKISDDLVKEGYHAGKIIGQVAKVAGGGGGGRPDMAQAGGSRIKQVEQALLKAEEIVKNKE